MKKISLFLLSLFLVIGLFLIKKPTKNFSQIASSHTLSDYSLEELHEMKAAGEEMLYWMEILKKGRSNVVAELLRHLDFYEIDHYPKGDVHSSDRSSTYYYHAHRSGEHGHFHTFLSNGSTSSHLIGISMDNKGFPTSLFTTNRWVTNETIKPASELLTQIANFSIDHSTPSWPTNRWLTHFFTFFRPQIEMLLIERDRAIATHSEEGEQFFNDRKYDILSSCDISISQQFLNLEKEINLRKKIEN